MKLPSLAARHEAAPLGIFPLEKIMLGHNGGHVMTETRKKEIAEGMRKSRAKVKGVESVGHRSAQAAVLATEFLLWQEWMAECAGITIPSPLPPQPPPPHH